MNTTNLLNLFLFTHITGLTLAGGMSAANFFTLRRGAQPALDAGMMIGPGYGHFSRLFWIGVAMLIVSGGMMMHLAYAGFMSQLWFQLKMGLIVLIVTIAIIVARKRRRLLVMMAEGLDARNGTIRSIHGTITTLHAIQLLFFLLIFVFAVFRF